MDSDLRLFLILSTAAFNVILAGIIWRVFRKAPLWFRVLAVAVILTAGFWLLNRDFQIIQRMSSFLGMT